MNQVWQREKLNCEVYCQPSPTPQVILELKWSFRVVLIWTKMARPLYSNSNQSLTIDHAGKGSSQAGSLQLMQFLKGLIAVGCLHIALPAVGSTSFQGKDIWVAHQSIDHIMHSTYRDLAKKS